jgi:hypothetical protein
MRTFTRIAVSAGVAGAALFLTAGPAAAAQAPNGNAPCLATVFQAQAVAAPQTVSNRILEIRELYLDGAAFGQVLQPLAHDMC